MDVMCPSHLILCSSFSFLFLFLTTFSWVLPFLIQILVRGPNVMKGYFKKPNATTTAVDEEGWFHTGEIGEIHPNGTLEVLGKKKKAKNTSESP